MSERTISITFQGPDVDENGVPLDDMTGVLGRLQRAVVRMAEFQAQKATSPTGPADVFRMAGTLRLRAAR